MELKEQIAGIIRDNVWLSKAQMLAPEVIADKILLLPEFKRLVMWDELVEALKSISEGKGRYSRDPLIHASNTIEDMKQLALEVLAKAKALGKEG